jgi:polysaccharide biosynthesis/export protein
MKLNPLAKNILFLIVFCILISSCSRKNRLLIPKENVRANPVYIINSNDSSTKFSYHRLEEGDRIALNFLNNYDLEKLSFVDDGGGQAGSFRIDKDGMAKLPLLGPVKLAGLNRYEASRKLEKEYVKYINNPLIEVSIINVEVDVFGEVSKQGKYFLENDKSTLIDVLSNAGGISSKAKKNNVRIIRGDPANPEIIVVDLRDIDALKSEALVIRDNDIIIVDTRGLYTNIEEIGAISTLLQPVLILTNIMVVIYTLSR